jgi:hypothetical protein
MRDPATAAALDEMYEDYNLPDPTDSPDRQRSDHLRFLRRGR